MIRRLVVRPAADAEIRDAVARYERERPGLGSEFEGALNAAIARIVQNPAMYSSIYRDVRRAVLHPFPYGVFYKVRRDVLNIVAVLHLARHPSHWRRRG